MLWMDDERNALVDFRQSACSVLEDGCMQGTHTLKDSFTLNARTGAHDHMVTMATRSCNYKYIRGLAV